VQKVLCDRAVLGEHQPCKMGEDGDRIPVGPPIPGYYPAVVDESLWYRAQASKDRRKKHKGPNTEFVNLFTGAVVNAHDGQPMHVQTSPLGKSKRQRRLVSYGHLSKVKGADPVSVPYSEFESAVLRYLNEVSLEDLQNKNTGNLLREKQQEKAGVEARLSDLAQVLSDPDTGNLSAVVLAVGTLEKRKAELADEIERLQAEAHSDRPLQNAQDIIRALDQGQGEERTALRVRLRSRIAELVECIRVKPEKHFGRVYTLAQIHFRSGLMKQVYFGPGFVGGLRQQAAAADFVIDLEDRAACRRQVFKNMAKLVSQAPEFTPPDEIPETVGRAADVWLGVVRSRMSKGSFRAVPSKVRRFVDFVGVDLPTDRLDRHQWRSWVRHLKIEVEEGRVAANTARVIYSRAREFVRWLVENQRAQELPDFAVSGRKVMG
jgi:uncharacterized small protein (DUF1192 family)